jgi:hypothetical protein
MNKEFKVLCSDGSRGLKSHFMAMVTVSWSGTAFRPMFIVTGEDELPDDLREFRESALS